MKLLSKKQLTAIRQLHYDYGYKFGIQIGLAMALAVMSTALLIQTIRIRYANHK